MLDTLIKLADKLDSIGLYLDADKITFLITKYAGIGGNDIIEELVTELINDTYRRGGSLGDLKETIVSLLSRHTDPKSLIPKDFEGLGGTPAEEAAEYLTDLVQDLWKQKYHEEYPTEMLQLQRPLEGRDSASEEVENTMIMDEDQRPTIHGRPWETLDQQGIWHSPNFSPEDQS